MVYARRNGSDVSPRNRRQATARAAMPFCPRMTKTDGEENLFPVIGILRQNHTQEASKIVISIVLIVYRMPDDWHHQHGENESDGVH